MSFPPQPPYTNCWQDPPVALYHHLCMEARHLPTTFGTRQKSETQSRDQLAWQGNPSNKEHAQTCKRRLTVFQSPKRRARASIPAQLLCELFLQGHYQAPLVIPFLYRKEGHHLMTKIPTVFWLHVNSVPALITKDTHIQYRNMAFKGKKQTSRSF